MKLITATAIVLATGFTCLAADPSDGSIQFLRNSDDNQLATSKLLTFFRANGHKAEKVGEEALIVTLKETDNSVILQPKLSIEGLDRIVLIKGYKIKWSYKHGDAVKELVWNANKKSNASQYYLNDDGNLEFRMFVTFIDDIDPAELTAAFQYIKIYPLIGLGLADAQWADYLE